MYFASYLGLGMRYGGGTCTKNHGSTFMTSFESSFHADHNGNQIESKQLFLFYSVHVRTSGFRNLQLSELEPAENK